jgi:predicted DsbA family dithiol-disulfide isomerase
MWSDIICPICGVTQYRLREAVSRFAHGAEVELVHRSFQVHPGLPATGITQTQLSLNAGQTIERMNAGLRPLEVAAEAEGFGEYHAIDRTLGPTELTHELLAYATEQGKHHKAWEGMFTAHFGGGRQLWTLPQLVAFAEEIGLDRDGAREALTSRRFRHQVEQEQSRAIAMGAVGTPFIVIDEKYGLAGGSDTAGLVRALERAWEDSHPIVPPVLLSGTDAAYCGLDGCVS